MDAAAEKTEGGGGTVREGGVSHLYVIETVKRGEREGNGYRCFFFIELG